MGLSLSIQPKVVKGSLTHGQVVSRRAVMPGCLIIYFDLSPPHPHPHPHTNVTLVQKKIDIKQIKCRRKRSEDWDNGTEVRETIYCTSAAGIKV